MNDIEKKRVGFARSKARIVLEKYLTNNPIEIPIPMEKIAAYYGFEIYELEDLNKDHKAIKVELKEEQRKLIGLNKSYHKHSKRYSIGHELGHYFLNHPPEEECTQEEIKLYNREADEFSAELLMPLNLIKDKIQEYKKDLKGLAKLLDVSEQALWIKIDSQKLSKLFLDL